jgi:hypothetical protein
VFSFRISYRVSSSFWQTLTFLAYCARSANALLLHLQCATLSQPEVEVPRMCRLLNSTDLFNVFFFAPNCTFCERCKEGIGSETNEFQIVSTKRRSKIINNHQQFLTYNWPFFCQPKPKATFTSKSFLNFRFRFTILVKCIHSCLTSGRFRYVYHIWNAFQLTKISVNAPLIRSFECRLPVSCYRPICIQQQIGSTLVSFTYIHIKTNQESSPFRLHNF